MFVEHNYTNLSSKQTPFVRIDAHFTLRSVHMAVSFRHYEYIGGAVLHHQNVQRIIVAQRRSRSTLGCGSV